MPVIPPLTNVTIPWQVLPTPGVTPYIQQQNFSAMIGECLSWNPDAAAMIPIWLNGGLRVVLDRRTWFGLFIKGQLTCPQATTAGTVQVTNGSNIVQGVSTSWTAALVGQQFRIGYNAPIYTITGVDPVGQQLTLELPWGSYSSAGTGYFILQYYYNLGGNVKYLKCMTNMQLGYKFRLHMTQDWLNGLDPWRQNQNWPWAAVPMPLDPTGNYLVELYPASWIQQAFPFLAYVQPPNLVNDNDSLPAYIRTDIVTKYAIAKALVWRGPKLNKYYDAAQSRAMMAEFEGELQNMAEADENLYRINIAFDGEDYPYYTPGGAMFEASHAMVAGGGGGYDW